ncbi:nitroreductase family protein [Kitasatospora paracochleata]|uniref:Nitroreductase family protein n=1 Tax=Kitasatospora paracochleata TaxID=58354 RepID=A0ABT1JAQ6_9ACTN|nr:hypothetical protein [Kitasatospora paracochleata]MCP2313751.1 hypothetical protein [Kitasatospora paracochleata]
MTALALTDTQLDLLAAAGGAAPSLHNSQPWRFCPTADRHGLQVRIDSSRAVPITDPDGRALHLSVGAAVFNLRVAAAQLGRTATVRLLPDPADPQLAAELDLSAPAEDRRPFGPDLYPAIAHRHSSRRPFSNRDIPEQILGDLVDAARAEGVDLAVLEEYGVRRVLELTTEAELRTAADLARQAETRSWLRPEGPTADGMPPAVLGPQDHDARVPVRSFTGHPPTRPAPPTERFEPLPQLATLATRTDHPADWLRTGQAMERVWLLATVHGVRASVLHQAVEWPDTRWRLREPEDGPAHVQLVLRLGYGPPGTPSPRRPVGEILDDTHPAEPHLPTG